MRSKDKKNKYDESDEGESSEESSEVSHRTIPPNIGVVGKIMLAPLQKRKRLLLKPQHFDKPKGKRFKIPRLAHQRNQKRNWLSKFMMEKKKKKIFG